MGHSNRLMVVIAVLCLCSGLSSGESNEEDPPRAMARPITNVYWGDEVVDDYQYLENVADPDVLQWVASQAAYARQWFERFPYREALAARVEELTHSQSPDYFSMKVRGAKIFSIKRQPPKQQSFLVLLSAVTTLEDERVLVDPNVIDPSGGTAIDFYEPSYDGRFVAVSLSEHGTEDGTIHIFDVETGAELPDQIPRVNGGTAGGDVAWTAAGNGLYYTRYPHPGERPDEDLAFYQQIWFHRLGTEISNDSYVLGETFPRIAEIELDVSQDGNYFLATVSDGDGGEYEFWLKTPEQDWVKFARFEDWIQEAKFGPDGAIYLRSRKDAPNRKILRLPPGAVDLAAATLAVPETKSVITSFVSTDNYVYVTEMYGGPSRLRVYDQAARPLREVEMGEICSISGPLRLEGDEILFRRESYVTPTAWYTFEPGQETPQVTALVTTSPADFSDCQISRVFATADDGAQIPINIIMREGTPLDGTAPLILNAYGSYGISMTPGFQATRLLWIEQGGIHAIANIRGGGEYGDRWHRAANLERKKTSMDDLAACARFLVDAGYTSRDRLAIEGGSAGGLLVFGTMAHYPDRMAAVVSHVGIGDALRTELSPNGEFNITEFGTVKNEVQYRGMRAYSPYHNIHDDVEYPAVLSLTGMNDPRVEPWQTFKMTARLQATGLSNPILMRVSMESGHGAGTMLSERDAQTVDVLSFLFMQLGVSYRPVPVAPLNP